MSNRERLRTFFRMGPFAKVAGALYASAALVGAVLIGTVLRQPGIVWPGLVDGLIGAGIGILATIPVELLSVWLFRARPNTRELATELRQVMGPVGTAGIAILALAGLGVTGLAGTLYSVWLKEV